MMTRSKYLRVEDVNGVTVATLADKYIFDWADAEIIGEELLLLVDRPDTRILLNFKKVDYISSGALEELFGALIRLSKKVKKEKGFLILCNINLSISEAFKRTQLNGYLTITPDYNTAIKILQTSLP